MLIALIQPEIKDFKIEQNIKNLTEICNNLSKDVEWIIFPEMFASGFVFDSIYAKESKTAGVEFLNFIAKKYHCATEGSLLIQNDLTKQNNTPLLYNRHYFITENNLWYYDKQKLFSLSDENKYIKNGEKSTIAEFNDWKINLKTCYDLRFSDICKNEYKNSDFAYDIMTFVASWPQNRISQWKILLQARAIENMCYTIGVNRCGTDSYNNIYSGGSCVVNTKGEFLKAEEYSTENVLYFNIDKDELTHQRNKFPVYKDW